METNEHFDVICVFPLIDDDDHLLMWIPSIGFPPNVLLILMTFWWNGPNGTNPLQVVTSSYCVLCVECSK